MPARKVDLQALQKLVDEGLSNKAIAANLHISEGCASKNRQRLMLARSQDVYLRAGRKINDQKISAITRLEERGWIRPVESSDERRRPYCITGAGRQHLEEQVSALDQIVRTALGRLKHA